MSITYSLDTKITPAQFIDVLNRTSLGERRPLDEADVVQGMVDNCNVMITAWDGDELIGVCRGQTDFSWYCYISELAVDEKIQKQGIGKQMLQLCQDQLGPRCKILLLAAPDAKDYYSHIGFDHSPRCYYLPGGSKMK